MVEGSSDMNVTNRKKIDKEESFEKIGELAEQKETVVSKNPDSTVTEHDKNAEKQQEMAIPWARSTLPPPPRPILSTPSSSVSVM